MFSILRSVRRPHILLAILPLALGSGCSGADNGAPAKDTAGGASALANVATPADSVAPVPAARPASRPPVPPARDADQDFLRHMLDHYEGAIALAHAQMMEPAGHGVHGGGADPAALDSKLDADKLEMLGLLTRHYGETYTPWAEPPARPATPGGAPAAAGGTEKHDAPEADLAAQFKAGVALVDRFMPQLARADVRDLARRVRLSQVNLARQFAPSAAP